MLSSFQYVMGRFVLYLQLWRLRACRFDVVVRSHVGWLWLLTFAAMHRRLPFYAHADRWQGRAGDATPIKAGHAAYLPPVMYVWEQ